MKRFDTVPESIRSNTDFLAAILKAAMGKLNPAYKTAAFLKLVPKDLKKEVKDKAGHI